jgi:hypothetical protein
MFNFVTVLSLVLFAAACVVWGWSYGGREYARPMPGGVWALDAWRGRLVLVRRRADPDPSTVRTDVILERRAYMLRTSARARVYQPGEGWHPYPEVLFLHVMRLPGWLLPISDGARGDDAMGFGWADLSVPGEERRGPVVRATWAPFWALALPCLALPAVRLWRGLRVGDKLAGLGRRGRAGRCAACGYDLRATPDRCPECGAVTASTA